MSALAGTATVCRAEFTKLAAQTRLRASAAVLAGGPWLFLVLIGRQSQLPVDTLFGRMLLDSGFAPSLVVLGFASTWLFPFLASIVGGDVFSGEDAHGSWAMLLTRSRSRGEIFAGKVLAAGIGTLSLVAVLAVSSLLAGVVLVGVQPLVDLSGVPHGAGSAALLVLGSWAVTVPAVLGFLGLAILLSVTTRSSWVGVVGPVLVGLLMVLAGLLGGGGPLRPILLTTGFDAWHGLLSTPGYARTGIAAVLLGGGYLLLCLAAGYRLLARRDIEAGAA